MAIPALHYTFSIYVLATKDFLSLYEGLLHSWILLDIRVIDTDAASYCHRPVCAVIKSAEEEKKRKYNEAVEARRGSFSPFVLSVDGYVGVEAGCVLRRIAEVLSRKWEKNYGQVMDWVRCTMSFAVIRATGLCLRGSRVPWRSGRGFDDGVGLPTCAND